jgi:hypothetical protein
VSLRDGMLTGLGQTTMRAAKVRKFNDRHDRRL